MAAVGTHELTTRRLLTRGGPRGNLWRMSEDIKSAAIADPAGKGLPGQPGNRAGGRPPGAVNKTTSVAREAIGKFVDDNAGRLQGWLDRIAEGVMDPDPSKPPGTFLIKPNPEGAFDRFQSVVEYHVPKLARTELTGADGGPVVVTSTPLDESL